MNKKQLLKCLAIAVIAANSTATLVAQGYDYKAKTINSYDVNGNLLSSNVAANVSYIEISDAKYLPKSFNVAGVNITLVPVVGTKDYQLKAQKAGNLSGWSEEDYTFQIRTFYLGETEVTNALWTAVMGTASPSAGNKGDNFPVTNVNWNDIDKFLTELNKKLGAQLDGWEFTLPTEAEWEYAASGGNQSKGYTYSGSNTLADVAWYQSNSVTGKDKAESTDAAAHVVKSKKPNELGLYDMSGNVFEWCGDYPYKSNNSGTAADYRAMRGGSWYSAPSTCGVGARNSSTLSKSPSVGFRIALKEKGLSKDKFTIPGTEISFAMIPLSGTNGFKLKGNINWPENERYFDIKPFAIGETEVTMALWKAVMGSLPPLESKSQTTLTGADGATGKTFITNQGDNYPAVNVSWDQISKKNGFLDRLNHLMLADPEMAEKMNGLVFALPTEAEWEYAASGGNRNDNYKFSGGNSIEDVAWYKANSQYSEESPVTAYTHEVKTKKANSLGLFDMSGNVWEWCSNNPHRFSSTANTNDPTIYATMRGGSWYSSEVSCATAYRESMVKNGQSPSVGFRLVLKEKQRGRETFTISLDDNTAVEFSMVPVEGTSSYKLKGNVNWEENDKYFGIKEFAIGETEVTMGLWKAVMGSLPPSKSTSTITTDGLSTTVEYLVNQSDKYPVVNVSWDDICGTDGFLDKLNALLLADEEMAALMGDRRFCLPSEAEWEFAAYGGNRNDSYDYSGSNTLDDVAWYRDNSTTDGEYNVFTHEVQKKRANGLGLYDMSGNVWEWCGNNPHRFSDPTRVDLAYRTMRGGSWLSSSNSCKISNRDGQTSNSKSPSTGFRLILK